MRVVNNTYFDNKFKVGSEYEAEESDSGIFRVKPDEEKEYPTTDGWGWFMPDTFHKYFEEVAESLENE